MWFTPEWNAVLKTIPIIKTTSFPFRWIIIWIPLCCITGAMAWQSIEHKIGAEKTSRQNELWMGLMLIIVAMLIESSLADKSYYLDPAVQVYDPAAIDHAWHEGKDGHIPPIVRITDFDQPQGERNPNESIITGESFLHCYNPTYGYRQETLPVGRLRSGVTALSIADGHLNIKNPACLIWPQDNNCTELGEEFKSNEIAHASRFLERKPVSFQMSKKQIIANNITLFSLSLGAIGMVVFFASFFKKILTLRRSKI
jgi:hypothetical protein